MQYIVFLVIKTLILSIAALPFSVLYTLSNGLAFILHRLLKYRSKIVYSNLKSSFPEKSDAEIESIAKEFYVHFTDLLVESFKAFKMTKADFRARIQVKNPEVITDLIDSGQSAIAAGGHIGNWEWSVFGYNIYMNRPAVAFYRPLANNKYLNEWVAKNRCRMGLTLASVTNTYNTFEALENQPTIFVLVGDQCPSNAKKAIWLDNFLNQQTPVLNGIEKYSKRKELPIIFFSNIRQKRGHYLLHPFMLSENPAKTATGEITAKYMHTLEELIKAHPSQWLWTHRRWKKDLPQGQKLYPSYNKTKATKYLQ